MLLPRARLPAAPRQANRAATQLQAAARSASAAAAASLAQEQATLTLTLVLTLILTPDQHAPAPQVAPQGSQQARGRALMAGRWQPLKSCPAALLLHPPLPAQREAALGGRAAAAAAAAAAAVAPLGATSCLQSRDLPLLGGLQAAPQLAPLAAMGRAAAAAAAAAAGPPASCCTRRCPLQSALPAARRRRW